MVQAVVTHGGHSFLLRTAGMVVPYSMNVSTNGATGDAGFRHGRALSIADCILADRLAILGFGISLSAVETGWNATDAGGEFPGDIQYGRGRTSRRKSPIGRFPREGRSRAEGQARAGRWLN